MERKRTRNILLRLSDEEWNYLKKNVDITGLTTQSYLRAMIKGVELNPRPPEIAANINRELSAIGVNINQIARKVNSRNFVQVSDLNEIKRLLQQLWDKVGEL